MNRIVVTARGNDLDCEIDKRFGRAAYFIAVDLASGALSVHENQQNLRAAQGAGIQSAQQVVALDAEAVISGHMGPKAFRVFDAAGIPVFLAEGGTIRQVLEQFRNGELEKVSGADVEGHWV